LTQGLAWHPKYNVLATCGRDRYIKTWEIDRSEVQYSPSTSIPTISSIWSKPPSPCQKFDAMSSVGRIAWRPGYDNQIASLPNIVDCNVYVWNVMHPSVPYFIFRHHSDVVTGIQWLPSMAGTLLLTCAKDGRVVLAGVEQAYCPYQDLRTSGIGWSPLQEVAFVNTRINR
jgi:WD40 repeat protein